MQEMLTTVWGFIKSHWLDIVLVIATLVAFDRLTAKPVDDNGKVITDPTKKRQWRLIWGSVLAILAIILFARFSHQSWFEHSVSKPQLANFPSWWQWVWVLINGIVLFILFIVANKNENITGPNFYKQGMWGSICWFTGLSLWILFGWSAWSLWSGLVLNIIGLFLRHGYTTENQVKKQITMFGEWLVDKPSWVPTPLWWYALNEGYLEPGLRFMLLPFDFPGLNFVKIVHAKRQLGTKEKPLVTEKLNTLPDDKSPVGAAITMKYMVTRLTGCNLKAIRDLHNTTGLKVDDVLVNLVETQMAEFASTMTMDTHLSLKGNGGYREDFNKKMRPVIESFNEKWGDDKVEVVLIDVSPPPEYEAAITAANSAKRDLEAAKTRAEAEAAKITTPVTELEKKMQTEEGAAAVAAFIEIKRAENARTVVLDRALGDSAAHILGSNKKSK